MPISREERAKRKPYIKDNKCHIPLYGEKEAICDSNKYDLIKDKIWGQASTGFAIVNQTYKNKKRKTVSLQRILFPDIDIIEFIDGDHYNWTSLNVCSIRNSIDIHGDIAIMYLDSGETVIFDSIFLDVVSKHKWTMSKQGYARTGGGGPKRSRKTQYMHKLLFPEIKLADHINRNKLDNRKENIRYATHSQNSINRGKNKNNTSGFKGVYFEKDRSSFSARIPYKGCRSYRIGNFPTAIEAARAYDAKAKEIYGEFAVLNFPDEIKEQSNG